MKTTRAKSGRTAVAFTLIEMIGVLAIMGILSAVLVPNVLKAIDSAATKAEVETMRNLGTVIESYLRQYQVLPTEENPAVALPQLPNWAIQLGTSTNLGASDIAINRRGQRRVYLIDPAAPRHRVIILSALDNQLVAAPGNALPRQTNITAFGFQQIWDTSDGSVPPLASWGGWAPWIARANGGSFLVIQRVNLAPIFNTDLRNLVITLNFEVPVMAKYRIIRLDGTIIAPPPTNASVNLGPLNLHMRERLDLYGPAPGYVLDSSYVLSGDKTFNFKGTSWIPQ